MCRLFGMSSPEGAVTARFWLLDASDSLEEQSRREPDGWGLGWFDAEGEPHVERDSVAAWRDADFDHAAMTATSHRFVAHVRFASTGPAAPQNTHPFELAGRLFAHNGEVEDLDALRRELGADADVVHGDTDSELTFALVTREIAASGGDVVEGLRRAGAWIAEHLPVYAWNVVLATPTALHALRWPATHELWWLEREAGGHHRRRHFTGAGMRAPLAVHAPELARRRATIVASEPMDEHPGWRELAPGELLVADADGTRVVPLLTDVEPRRPLTLDDLDEVAAAAQR
jgi:glutamine amidotransferase